MYHVNLSHENAITLSNLFWLFASKYPFFYETIPYQRNDEKNREKDEEMLLFSSYGEWDHWDVKIQKLFIQLLGAKFSYINQL